MLLATPIDRSALPDTVEPLKDLVVDLAQALVAVRAQADAQMASLAAQLAEFKRRVFGARTEVLDALQPELWQDRVEVPVPPEEHREVAGHAGAGARGPALLRGGL